MKILLAHLLGLVVLSVAVAGTIIRTKALWSGRRGPPLAQLVFDVVRLLRKRAVYSTVTTPIFRLTPWLGLATSLGSALLVPAFGFKAPVGFPYDFVAFAYVWGLGRTALMLGALDTGSSFEGMGASREASFAALLEPAFVVVVGAACLLTNERSFSAVLALRPTDGAHATAWVAGLFALLVVVQVESARMPVDDPTTHLELTMVHEVMILDHSGPDLAALQAASALKLTVGLAVVAAMMNPMVGGSSVVLTAAVNIALTLGLAVVVGSVESLIARLKMEAVPRYIMAALAAAAVALIATTFGGGVR
jgi:formate hydrogenlyase subunit 4